MVKISSPVNNIIIKSEDFFMFGKRLKEERSRVGLTQPKLGEIVGLTKRTVIDWEKDKSSPTAIQLMDMAKSGIDVSYLLTGVRTSDNELTVLDKIVSAKDAAAASGNMDGADNLLQAAQDWQGDIIKRAENAKVRADVLREVNLMLCGLDNAGFEQALTALSDIYFQTKLKA